MTWHTHAHGVTTTITEEHEGTRVYGEFYFISIGHIDSVRMSAVKIYYAVAISFDQSIFGLTWSLWAIDGSIC
mgnify:CR=1 FL=1